MQYMAGNARAQRREGRARVSATSAFLSFLRDSWRAIREIYLSIILSMLLGIATGVFFARFVSRFYAFPGLVITIPALLAMRGNIFGASCSRVGTALHMGLIGDGRGRILSIEIANTALLSALTSIVIAVFAVYIAQSMGISASYATLGFISMVSALISTAIMIPASYALSVGSYRMGWNPDNVSIPVVATFGDLIMVLSLTATMSIFFAIASFVFEAFTALYAIAILITLMVLGKKGKSPVRAIIVQSLPTLTLCAFISVFAGIIMDARVESMARYSALLFILPVFNEQVGNLGGVLSSRLTSAVHLGTMRVEKLPDNEAVRNFSVIMLVSALTFISLGIISHAISLVGLINSPGLLHMIFLTLVGGLSMMIIVCIISYYLIYSYYKLGLDPDNVVIPLLTTTIDLLGISLIVYLSLIILPL